MGFHRIAGVRLRYPGDGIISYVSTPTEIRVFPHC